MTGPGTAAFVARLRRWPDRSRHGGGRQVKARKEPRTQGFVTGPWCRRQGPDGTVRRACVTDAICDSCHTQQALRPYRRPGGRACNSPDPQRSRQGRARTPARWLVQRIRSPAIVRTPATDAACTGESTSPAIAAVHRPGAFGRERSEGSPWTSIIRPRTLTKFYGSHRGIVDVDLEVQPGEIFGFLGPNGAGKTTTIRILLDLIRPTSGRAFVFGVETSADPAAIHRRVGYLPGEFALFDRLTGGQTIDYFANLRGGVDPLYQADLIARFDLDPSQAVQGVLARQQAEGRSGDRAPAPPDLLVLDEPTAGLDPLVQQTFFRSCARRSTRAGRRSCRRTSSARSRRRATGWRSSATAGWSRSTASRRFAICRITRSSCASPRTRSRPADFAQPAGRQRRRRRRRRPSPAGDRLDGARRPGRGPARAPRFLQPGAEPRGHLPGPVRPRGRRGEQP